MTPSMVQYSSSTDDNSTTAVVQSPLAALGSLVFLFIDLFAVSLIIIAVLIVVNITLRGVCVKRQNVGRSETADINSSATKSNDSLVSSYIDIVGDEPNYATVSPESGIDRQGQQRAARRPINDDMRGATSATAHDNGSHSAIGEASEPDVDYEDLDERQVRDRKNRPPPVYARLNSTIRQEVESDDYEEPDSTDRRETNRRQPGIYTRLKARALTGRRAQRKEQPEIAVPHSPASSNKHRQKAKKKRPERPIVLRHLSVLINEPAEKRSQFPGRQIVEHQTIVIRYLPAFVNDRIN